MPNSPLRYTTPAAWTDAVMADFGSFLLDHATAEKKASGMAISMLSHYPDRIELVTAMADLAIEELTHYREVLKWIHQRGLTIGPDHKDPYVVTFRESIRQGREVYLLDRLLTASIIEARGAERFALVAAALAARLPEKILPIHRALRGAPLRVVPGAGAQIHRPRHDRAALG